MSFNRSVTPKRKEPIANGKLPRPFSPKSTSNAQSDVALAAVASSKNQKIVSEFINFILESLERNSKWISGLVEKQNNFRCALLAGAGPNRFQMQQILYPINEDDDLQLQVEIKDSEDYDKIGLAALLKLSTAEVNRLMEFLKSGSLDNIPLRKDLRKGKDMGINFYVLRPVTEKQFRVVERIAIANIPPKKPYEEKPLIKSIKKLRRI